MMVGKLRKLEILFSLYIFVLSNITANAHKMISHYVTDLGIVTHRYYKMLEYNTPVSNIDKNKLYEYGAIIMRSIFSKIITKDIP